MSGAFLRFPLALLRKCSSETDFFNRAASFAAVNAGIGFQRQHGEEIFNTKAKELSTHSNCSAEAVVGAALSCINLGDKTGRKEKIQHAKILEDCVRSPIISLKSMLFWEACYTARHEAGESDRPERGISWREWRILVAIASLKPNRKGFSIAGWESISHRASGFHRKEDFQAFERTDEPWSDLTGLGKLGHMRVSLLGLIWVVVGW